MTKSLNTHRGCKKVQQLGVAKNQRAAASICGIPFSTVSAARDAGCPAFHVRGSVDCDALIDWIASHKSEIAVDNDVDYGLEKALKVKAERELKEFQLATKRGEYVPIKELESFLAGIAHHWRTIVLRLHLIAPALYGQPVEKIEQLLIAQEDDQLNAIQKLKDAPNVARESA